jgi:hypothetical protein
MDCLQLARKSHAHLRISTGHSKHFDLSSSQSILNHADAFYVTYVNDDKETAIIFDCKMHVMVVARKPYMKPQEFIFLSSDGHFITVVMQ